MILCHFQLVGEGFGKYIHVCLVKYATKIEQKI